MKKITVTALRGITEAARQKVGRIDSEARMENALNIAIPRIVDEAKKAGLQNADRIVEQARNGAEVPNNGSPRAKFGAIEDAIVDALRHAWQQREETGAAGKQQNMKTAKGGEHVVMGKMLFEGFDVYMPLSDDHGVDAVVRWEKGPFLPVQIKATSKGVLWPANFDTRGLTDESVKGFFVFHSEEWNTMWILSREDTRRLETKPGVITFSVMRKGVLRQDPTRRKHEARNFELLKQES